jgi:hypothetical protein
VGSVSSYANSPFLWVCALAVFGVIILQTVIYMRVARAAGPDFGFTGEDRRTSFRSGAVAAVGPSLAIVIVVQPAVFLKQPRITVIAIVVAAVAQLVLVSNVPALANSRPRWWSWRPWCWRGCCGAVRRTRRLTGRAGHRSCIKG